MHLTVLREYRAYQNAGSPAPFRPTDSSLCAWDGKVLVAITAEVLAETLAPTVRALGQLQGGCKLVGPKLGCLDKYGR